MLHPETSQPLRTAAAEILAVGRSKVPCRPAQRDEEPVIDFLYGTHVGLQHVGARLAVGAVIRKGKYPDHR
jgi:hypothetical protein